MAGKNGNGGKGAAGASTDAGAEGKAAAAVAPRTGSSLVNKNESALAETGMMMDFASDAGSGMEGADRDSFAIPFLAVLQGLSPVVVEEVPGAKPGLLMNTVTQKFYDSVLVVPCAFKRSFLRWAPRDEGGGFKGEYSVSEVDGMISRGEAARDDEGRLTIDGDFLRDTRQHFVMLIDEETGGYSPAVMSCASTQVKVSKRWLASMNSLQLQGPDGRLFTPPTYSHAYRVETDKQKNDSGSWYTFNIKVEGPVGDAGLYAAAKAFNAQVVSGKVSVQPPTDDEHAAGSDGGGSGKGF